ncbi:MAG: Uma2 family endonuclease [Verrucomicrobia bacterium]|nr:Uma2 family endonuclease [Verrucomicrobiota bacterium]
MAIAMTPRPVWPKARRLWTFDEMVAKLPETNAPTELWDGEIITPPAPTPDHQDIVLDLAAGLKTHVARRKSGKVFVSPIDVVFSPRRTVQPDVVFISKERRNIIQDYIRGVPDLVIEVVSQGSWRRDRVEKQKLYGQYAVPEFWIVDPEAKMIEVFVWERGAYRLPSRAEADGQAASKVLPGFVVSWQDLSA